MNSPLKIKFYLLMFAYRFALSEVLLELTCDSDSDCIQFRQPQYQITCVESKCTCKDMRNHTVDCQPVESKVNNIIGGPCPCSQPHSQCNTDQGYCYCKNEFVATNDKRRCIKESVMLGETCENDSQCIKTDRFSECALKTKNCTCQPKFIKHEDMCVSVVNLDETCQDNSQCQNRTENSICVRHKCVCEKEYVAAMNNLSCLRGADYNEPCQEDNQCIHLIGPGAICYSGYCTCNQMHYMVIVDNESPENSRKICEVRVELGQYCREHNHCYQYHLKSEEQTMECNYGQCNCRPGYHQHELDCMSDSAEHLVTTLSSWVILIGFFLSVL